MVGYPKRIATKEDFLHLLADPRFRARAREDLAALVAVDDDLVEAVISMDDEGVPTETKMIANPLPGWKRMGFESRDEVLSLSRGGV